MKKTFYLCCLFLLLSVSAFAADTITVLDGLLYATSANTDVYTINSENQSTQTANTEAVAGYVVELPANAKTARVIFNNNYTASGSQVHVRVVRNGQSRFWPPDYAAKKVILNWTAVAAAANTSSGEIDVSVAKLLSIDCAITSTTAHSGTEIRVQIKTDESINDWVTYSRFIGPTGTAVKSDCSGVTAAGQTVVGVTNPTTGGLAKVGKMIFLLDTGNVLLSQKAYLLSTTGD